MLLCGQSVRLWLTSATGLSRLCQSPPVTWRPSEQWCSGKKEEAESSGESIRPLLWKDEGSIKATYNYAHSLPIKLYKKDLWWLKNLNYINWGGFSSTTHMPNSSIVFLYYSAFQPVGRCPTKKNERGRQMISGVILKQTDKRSRHIPRKHNITGSIPAGSLCFTPVRFLVCLCTISFEIKSKMRKKKLLC